MEKETEVENKIIFITVVDKGGNTLVIPVENNIEMNQEKYDEIKETLKCVADKAYDGYKTCSWCENKKPDVRQTMNDEYIDDLICGDCLHGRESAKKVVEYQQDTGIDPKLIEERNRLKQAE